MWESLENKRLRGAFVLILYQGGAGMLLMRYLEVVAKMFINAQHERNTHCSNNPEFCQAVSSLIGSRSVH